MKTKWMIIPVIAMTFGCTREIDTNITYIDGEFTLYATSGDNETRTILQEDGRVFWKPKDCITVFYGNVPGKFTSTNTEPAASAEFTGSLGSFVLDGETEFKAIYPYSDIIVTPTDEGILSLYLPSEQTAVEGTFADDLFICVAKSKDFNLHFYNVCGGVSFSLARDDIKKVVFRGNNKETLAGTMFVDFAADGIPQVLDFTAGRSSVTLSAPEGETLKKGVWYYLVTAPQNLSQGYTMELWADEIVETVSSESAVTIRRSAWGVLKDIGSTTTTVEVPEAIDLGLPSGLKWASFNLGASKPEEYGYYYAWGETTPKQDYRWSTYKWCMGEEKTITKYCIDFDYGYNGFTDGKKVLDLDDDAAAVTLSDKWRMPTEDERDELCSICTWEWVSISNVNGYRVTGPNGNSIFIPAAGYRYGDSFDSVGSYGFYWTSSLSTVSGSDTSHPLSFGSDFVAYGSYQRYSGLPIRPVYGVSKTDTEYAIPEIIDLGLPSGLKWASFNLGATKPEEYGDYFAWGETDPFYVSLNPLVWKEGKVSGYDWPSYKWCNGSGDILTKYSPKSSQSDLGFADDRIILSLEDDAAHVNLGGKWRMPTVDELDELYYNCTWEWITIKEVEGYKVIGPNTNFIFLPASGMWSSTSFFNDNNQRRNGWYWSSSLHTNNPVCGIDFQFYDEYIFRAWTSPRKNGLTIRPVFGDYAIPVESVSLNNNEIELRLNESYTLVASVLPENATNKNVSWSSSDNSIATVSSCGVIRGVGVGSATITATTTDGKMTASCSFKVYAPSVDMVDLGLPSGLLWATCNLGATKPEEYGDYFAWGETEPYYVSLNPLVWKEGKESGYDWPSYKWCMGLYYQLTKYCTESTILSFGYNGFMDDKTILDPEDDAAHVRLGGKWRIPTDAEWTELREKCTWRWTSLYGIYGREVTGPNGKSIFLPASDEWNGTTFNDSTYSFGLYWSSSLYTDSPDSAFFVSFYSGQVGRYANPRCYGFSIRPVYDGK